MSEPGHGVAVGPGREIGLNGSGFRRPGAFALVAAFLALRAYTFPAPEFPCPLDLTAGIAARELDSSFRLRSITAFPWRSVSIFGEYAPAEDVRSQTGHPYVGNRIFGHVPECAVVFIFDLGQGKTCEATLDRYAGRSVDLAREFDPSDPYFTIRKEGRDPHFTNCGPLEE